MLTSQRRYTSHQSMRLDLWGSREGQFVFLFSNVQHNAVFLWTGMFSILLLVWPQIFFHTDKNDAFSKISGYLWTGP